MTDNAIAKRKRTNNDLQNITQKTKDWATWTPQKNSNNDGYVPFVVITNRPILSLLMSYRRIFSDKAMGVTSGTGTSYPSGAHGFLPVY